MMANILVIEDEPELRSVVATMLIRAGHSVTEADDGAVGVALFGRQDFDLVVTDIVMPEKEGMQTIREIREMDPNARIVAISGGGRNASGMYLTMARHLGAARVLAKPFRNAELLALVDECLADRAA